jgi:hypothetical protein
MPRPKTGREKPVAISVRVDPELRKVAEKAALDDRRTIASVAKLALEEYLRARGYLPDNESKKGKGKG